MIFKGLEIKQSYEQVEGRYQHVWKGKFDVQSPRGDQLWLVVDAALCQKLIDVCADHIVDVAEEAAISMKSTLIEQLKAPLISSRSGDPA